MATVRKTEERRKFVRIGGRYAIRHEKLTIPRGTGAREDAAKNISANGILFESSTLYDMGAILRLELLVRGIDKFKVEFYKHKRLSNTEPFVLLGKVVRVEMVQEGVFDIGVRLVGVDRGNQRALEKYIDAHAK